MAPRAKKQPLSYDKKKRKEAITPIEYSSFQRAYDYFNETLFNVLLPNVLITLQRKAGSGGYFSPKRFTGRIEKTDVHEVALNPDGFVGRTDEWICSVLGHEMCHVCQQVHGKPSPGRYHNKEWAQLMKQIGLQPSSTGQVGGKETGQRMSHYVVPDGTFALAYAKLAATGFQLRWQSAARSVRDGAKRDSKTKFSCPACGLNAWAKLDARLMCKACLADMVPEVTLSYDRAAEAA